MSGRVDGPELVVLGCGYAGLAVAREARMQGIAVLVHARSEERAAALTREGLQVWHAPVLEAEGVRAVLEARRRAHVLVAFPPDGQTDARLEGAFAAAGHVVYLSTTGVYGERRGKVDETTPPGPGADPDGPGPGADPDGPGPGADPDGPVVADERGARWLEAEGRYLRAEATVLRCAAIYGPDRGVHMRVLRGEHRLPGDGAQTTSRIHVLDLARLVLSAMAKRVPSGTFVVGDRHPAPHREVVEYVCRTYGVPFPPSIPLAEAHPSLRADRAVDPSRILAATGLTLRYPSYREGMSPVATGLLPRDGAGVTSDSR